MSFTSTGKTMASTIVNPSASSQIPFATPQETWPIWTFPPVASSIDSTISGVYLLGSINLGTVKTATTIKIIKAIRNMPNFFFVLDLI